MARRGKRLGRGLDAVAKRLLRYRVFSIPARFASNSWLAWSFVSRLDRVRARRKRERISAEDLPQHVSIIMDGNRRFAWSLSLGTDIGHRHGKENEMKDDSYSEKVDHLIGTMKHGKDLDKM